MRVLTTMAALSALLAIAACKPGTPDAGGGRTCSTSVPRPRITEQDNGKTICMGRKAPLTVTLHGSAGDPWQAVSASGPVLTETGRPAVSGAVTTAAYQSNRAGSGTVSAHRKSGRFEITVIVRD
ncbi:hypothetical protein [Amycolatopsis sp. CA-230715]|uniref:hypothetical protein n=1 Tax=Amycolatopsis sp. CA-230715 TaxID=2745196 RepID=UPI001C01FB64|nr:hypothetical protein [Amycolatopsis sp. CA-230715]QWF82474.1 hypothetical protein HUW46_05911 [Amycolatopsis sp. CA-230715]